jgi:hypothetical protein
MKTSELNQQPAPANTPAASATKAAKMSFSVRVTLHGGKGWDDYTQLHAAMKTGGFNRYRKLNGQWWRLPDGEYVFDGTATAAQVGKSAFDIADKVKKNPAIYVTPAGGSRFWTGLDKVTAEDAVKG